jgi:hypothetical protein
MSINKFLSNENVNLLWEVLKEEEIIKIQNQDILSQIIDIFNNNLKKFYENEKNKNINLVDINKKYIILILNYIKTNYTTNPIHNEKSNYPIINAPPNIPPNIPPSTSNKIQIYKEFPKKELITFEEFQKDKRSQFDKDLNKRQEEFTNLMSMDIPPVPNFSDNVIDTPITEIEKEIKKITAQRNYDIEQINKTYNKEQDTKWLNPLETTIKNEKLQSSPPQRQFNENYIKYIKIEEEVPNDNIYKNQIIELNAPKKNISWANDIVQEYTDNTNENDDDENVNINYKEEHKNEENNLFSKLKKKSQKIHVIDYTNVKNDNNNNENNDIKILKKEIENINNKIDVILNILKK